MLDAMFPPANSIDVIAGQQSNGEWSNTTPLFPATIPTLIFEYTAFASNNIIGVWSGTDSTALTTLDVFLGPAGPGTAASLTWGLTGLLTITGTAGQVNTVANFAGIDPFLFGFYIRTPEGNTFYSVDALNANGEAHVLGFVKPGTDTWAIAFEDLAFSNSDLDYNDDVIRVESVNIPQVPEPMSLILVGSGLIGLAGYARKRMKK
jgi:hypothetical protein